MDLPTFVTTKKTFYYNFFPSKAEEEAHMARDRSSNGAPNKYDRIIVEIRNIYPRPMPRDPEWPWYITKTIGHNDHAFGRIPLTFIETFEHVLSYWDMSIVVKVIDGQSVCVTLWDMTDEGNRKKYDGDYAFLKMMPNDDFLLYCPAEKLKVGNKHALRWDKEESAFLF